MSAIVQPVSAPATMPRAVYGLAAIGGSWAGAPWCGPWLSALAALALVGTIDGLALLVATPAWRDELTRLWLLGPFARKPESEA